jgi:hypothetical protein
VFDLTARPGQPDHGAFLHDVVLRDVNRAEVGERDGVAVGGLDRHRTAASGDGSGERHGACSRCPNRLSGARSDVCATMLSCRIRIAAQHERAQDVA